MCGRMRGRTRFVFGYSITLSGYQKSRQQTVLSKTIYNEVWRSLKSYAISYLIADTIQVNPYLSFTLPLIPLSSGGFVFNSPNTTPPSDKAEKTLCANISFRK